jgi:hypothetical protein
VKARVLKGRDKRKKGFAADHLHCAGVSTPVPSFRIQTWALLQKKNYGGDPQKRKRTDCAGDFAKVFRLEL